MPFFQLDPAGTWAVDNVHSEIGFSVRHLGAGKTRGKFTDFTGTVIADPKNIAKSSVSFTVQAKSIDTANTARDNHLRSADFFDVATFPTLSFVSTKVEKAGKGYRATGKLTIHGVTKIISFPFAISGPTKGMQKETRAGVEARFSVNRKDFGLVWNGLVEGTQVVGEQVEISLDLEGIKK
ncbi:YceI family protein [Armatimonas sp.]|uniref:YceI family protein n=1 Tax=Armatimonas sp. TaxID=1872638 RepID=UPI003753D384